MRTLFLLLFFISNAEIFAQEPSMMFNHPCQQSMKMTGVHGITVKEGKRIAGQCYLSHAEPMYRNFQISLGKGQSTLRDSILGKFRSVFIDTLRFDSAAKVFLITYPSEWDSHSETFSFDSLGRLVSIHSEHVSENGSEYSSIRHAYYFPEENRIELIDSSRNYQNGFYSQTAQTKLLFDKRNDDLLSEITIYSSSSRTVETTYRYSDHMLKSMKQTIRIPGQRTLSKVYCYTFAERLNFDNRKRKKKTVN